MRWEACYKVFQSSYRTHELTNTYVRKSVPNRAWRRPVLPNAPAPISTLYKPDKKIDNQNLIFFSFIFFVCRLQQHVICMADSQKEIAFVRTYILVGSHLAPALWSHLLFYMAIFMIISRKEKECRFFLLSLYIYAYRNEICSELLASLLSLSLSFSLYLSVCACDAHLCVCVCICL